MISAEVYLFIYEKKSKYYNNTGVRVVVLIM